MAVELGLGLVGTGLSLGLRHGVDWDHIAAITDVTSTQAARSKGFLLGTLYALGHASVVSFLGLLALWAGSTLPAWVDGYMEMVVGLTLVSLGIWVFWSLFHDRENFRLRSRWMLIFAAARRAYRWLLGRVSGHVHPHPEPEPQGYGARAAYGIGMIHGLGAETGSQVLLFAAAAGAESNLTGTLLLLAFVIGLIVSNSLITVGSIVGFWGARTRTVTYLAIGLITGTFSLGLGTLFLLQQGALLPTIFA